VPKPESGTKRPKMTTPRNRTSSMALSTKLLKLHIFWSSYGVENGNFSGGHWGVNIRPRHFHSPITTPKSNHSQHHKNFRICVASIDRAMLEVPFPDVVIFGRFVPDSGWKCLDLKIGWDVNLLTKCNPTSPITSTLIHMTLASIKPRWNAN
jgi:hypothetical protein